MSGKNMESNEFFKSLEKTLANAFGAFIFREFDHFSLNSYFQGFFLNISIFKPLTVKNQIIEYFEMIPSQMFKLYRESEFFNIFNELFDNIKLHHYFEKPAFYSFFIDGRKKLSLFQLKILILGAITK